MPSLRAFLNMITVPGVVIHEFAHKQMCDFFNIGVEDVVYFQFDDPAGYVEHAVPRSYVVSILISIAPFLVNTTLAFALSTITAYIFLFDTTVVDMVTTFPDNAYTGIGLWLSVSLGAHSFPSSTDADTIWNQSKRQWYNPLLLLGIPIIGGIKLANTVSNAYTRPIIGLVIAASGVYIGTHPQLFWLAVRTIFH